MDTANSRKHRRSVRLAEYDYARVGAYFVTICTKDRECLFGNVDRGVFTPSPIGGIVAECWEALPRHFAHVSLDAFVVMPNHIHGVIVIQSDSRGMACHAPTNGPVLPRRFGKPPPRAISAIVGSYKSAVTRAANKSRRTPAAPIWQRNYYEHVVRNEDDLNRIGQYIIDNPARWSEDEYFGT